MHTVYKCMTKQIKTTLLLSVATFFAPPTPFLKSDFCQSLTKCYQSDCSCQLNPSQIIDNI